MNKVIGITLGLLVVAINSWSAPKQLSVNDVSASNLKIILSEKYGTSIDEEGILIVHRGKNQQVVVIIDQKEKTITFWNAWIAKPAVTKEKCFELINNWLNNHSVFVTAYDNENKRFARAYVMTFKGGIIVENLTTMLDEYFIDDEDFVKHFYDAGVLK